LTGTPASLLIINTWQIIKTAFVANISYTWKSQNNLWIGTWGDGITVFNQKENTFKHLKNDPAKTSTSVVTIWTIFEDRENIWVGIWRRPQFI
jgi:ligand-binding sensor domain-containing protein